MWMVDGFAYPHRVVIQDTEPDSQGRVRVCCYDNDGAIYVARADVKDLKQVVIYVSQTGDNMETIRPEDICIDAMEAAFGRREVIIFSKLNAFKYIWRAELKNNELQDLEKAAWYLNKAIELLREEAESGMEKKNFQQCSRCNCDHE